MMRYNFMSPMGLATLISLTMEAAVAGYYLSRQNHIQDIAWALPMITFYAILSFMTAHHCQEH